MGPVRELVVAGFPGGARFVVLSNVVVDKPKVLDAGGEFLNIGDVLVVGVYDYVTCYLLFVIIILNVDINNLKRKEKMTVSDRA